MCAANKHRKTEKNGKFPIFAKSKILIDYKIFRV